MDPTNPTDGINVAPENQETLDKSNVQKRFDEMTAQRRELEKKAEEQSAQIAQLTALVARQMEAQHEQRAPVAEQLPEGVDANLVKFLSEKFDKALAAQTKQTEQLYWQMQNQMDQSAVASKYNGLPPEVVSGAANRLTALKQRYGNAANMDDAVALEHFEWFKKNQAAARGQQFNAMGQPVSAQSGLPNFNAHSTNLASPASHPDWDRWDVDTQNAKISEWEKKGGKLNIG